MFQDFCRRNKTEKKSTSFFFLQALGRYFFGNKRRFGTLFWGERSLGHFFVQIVFVDMIRSLLWVSMRTKVWDSWDSPEFRSKAAVDTPLACGFLILPTYCVHGR